MNQNGVLRDRLLEYAVGQRSRHWNCTIFKYRSRGPVLDLNARWLLRGVVLFSLGKTKFFI